MKLSALKSSTAAVMCLSLMAQPIPVFAQTSDVVDSAGEAVSDLTDTAEEVVEETAEAAAEEAEAAAEDAEEAAAEKAAADAAAAEAQAEADQAAAEMQAEEDRIAADEAAAEAQAEAAEAAKEEAAAQAEAEAAAQAEAEAAAEAAAETEAEAAAEGEAEAAEVESEPNVETNADAVETEAEAGADAAEQEESADADAAAAEKAEEDAAAATEAEAESEATADGQAGEDAQTETVDSQTDTEQADETAVTDDTEAADENVEAAEDQGETQETTETDTDTGATSDADTDQTEAAEAGAGEAGGEQLTDTERQARAQERAEQEQAAAAASEEAEAEAEVETQTVTEEDVRSSAEDFDTSVTGDAQAAAAPSKKKGLSTFEKALLLGVGAAVVGTILSNGDKVVSNSGDRVVVERDGELRVLKNDDELLRRPGAQVRTQTYQDGSTRSTLDYEDGSQIVTIRAADGTVLRRTLIRGSDGQEVVLFDDTQKVEPVDFDRLPSLETISARQRDVALDDEAALQEALERVMLADVDRRFSLRQVREYKRVRALAPQIELDAITFETDSAAIRPDQAEALADLGRTMRKLIEDNPRAVFLVEGHTDAVGNATYNLALSDRRAETVALALTEYFDVPPQNLITQGYGESDLKVRTLSAERANRRATLRNITHLLN